jgi:hypothetical protein
MVHTCASRDVNLRTSPNSLGRKDRLVRSESAATARGGVSDGVDTRACVVRVRNHYINLSVSSSTYYDKMGTKGDAVRRMWITYQSILWADSQGSPEESRRNLCFR